MEKKLDKAAVVLTKLMEVAHWIGAVATVVGLVLLFTMGEGALVSPVAEANEELAIYGFRMTVADGAGAVDLGALKALLAVGVANLALMALVFRNVHLILKSAQGGTPFQSENVGRVSRIGCLLMAVPVVGLLASGLARLTLGVNLVESSVDLPFLVIGLVALCLSRVFARGMELEAETEGLL